MTEVDVDAILNLPPPPEGPGPLPLGISGGDDWVHPFIGARVEHSLGERWTGEHSQRRHVLGRRRKGQPGFRP